MDCVRARHGLGLLRGCRLKRETISRRLAEQKRLTAIAASWVDQSRQMFAGGSLTTPCS